MLAFKCENAEMLGIHLSIKQKWARRHKTLIKIYNIAYKGIFGRKRAKGSKRGRDTNLNQ